MCPQLPQGLLTKKRGTAMPRSKSALVGSTLLREWD